MTDWPEMTKELSPRLRDLRQAMPEVMKAFSAVSQAALAPQALDTKTKELIALAIAVALRCDDCIAFHVRPRCSKGPRARRSPKRSAWRSIWEPVRR